MANEPKSDRDLALWMLERMKDSSEFLAVLEAARRKGAPDVLDTPDYVARHKDRLKKLYQGSDEEDVGVTSSAAAKMAALAERDLLSSREELIEKAIAAYLAQHPRGTEGLPREWQSTFDLARAAVEGRVTGAFGATFVADLAQSAREEMARQAEKARARDRGGRDR